MEKKQPVAAFAWEPAGDRFALVLGDVPKLEVTFYTMKVSATHRMSCVPVDACGKIVVRNNLQLLFGELLSASFALPGVHSFRP